MNKSHNIKGERFNRLVAIEYMYRDKGKSSRWLCQCDCGKKVSVEISSLRSGNTQSCGCLRLERVRDKISTHGKSYTTEYHAWGNMIQRCTNPSNPEYKNYGGRGIFISPEWRNSFENFLEDMGPKPNKSLSLDRINNEDGYYKENCHWASSSAQVVNRRDVENKTVGIKNISYSKRDDLYYVGIERKGIRHRKAFKNLDDAINWKENTLKNINSLG